MALYQYRCVRHGNIEVLMSMGTAPESITCKVCGQPAKRVFTAPMIPHPDQAVIHAIENSELSAHEPEIVTSVPRAGQKKPTRFTTDPRHQRLPKP